MIFVHDKGRMCNNILQYAHVYAWGREHGRNTMSMRFAYKYPYFNICKTHHHNFLTYLFAKYGAKWGLIPQVHFDKEGADYSREEELMLTKNMILVGGWYARWYDLFLKYKPEILNLFAFLPEVEEAAQRTLYPSPFPSPRGGREGAPLKIGLHIRRGDYKTWQNGQFYFTDEEYVRIIKSFLNNLRTPAPSHPRTPESIQIYICGNDPTLNKDYYIKELTNPSLGEGMGVGLSFPSGNPGEDLCLLSHCDYLIGPPSTFTLVASMYHDVPLYWISDPESPVTEKSFQHFDYLFKNII